MIISQTPLRIGIAGGGTDLPAFYKREDGYVLNAAIDKFVYVVVKERFDDKIYLNYSQKEIVDNIDEIQHGLIREAMRKTEIFKGVEITTLADVPSEGSGLGSSSAVTVCLLNALYMLKGIQVTAETLAREACDIEINILKKPIGKQDQYIAAYGGIRMFGFRANENVLNEKIHIENSGNRLLGSNLLLFFTNITRDANQILHQQQLNMIDKFDLMCKMRDQAIEVKEYLIAHENDKIGDIFRKGWEYKRQLAKGVSIPEIDFMLDKAMSAGALGGKITGAGGGGFLLLYVQRDRQNNVRKVLKDYRELPFFLENDGSKIIFNMRKYEWK